MRGLGVRSILLPRALDVGRFLTTRGLPSSNMAPRRHCFGMLWSRLLSIQSRDSKTILSSLDNVQIVPHKLPRAYCEMSNQTLLIYAARDNALATRELLAREIMAVDGVEWQGAQERLEEIENTNKAGMFAVYLPYKIGIVSSLAAGIASLPLTYHLPTVLWFNEHYVTADVAEPQ
jgi:hypothetical protein